MTVAVVLCIIFGAGFLFSMVDNLDCRDRLKRSHERYDALDASKTTLMDEFRKTVAENEQYIVDLDCVRAYGLAILNSTLPKNLTIRSASPLELDITRDRVDALAVKLAGENMSIEPSSEGVVV